MNRYTRESSEGCIFEVQLEYPKELRELHDYLLAPEKMEIKENNLPIYQFKKADIYNIPIGSVKKLMSIFFSFFFFFFDEGKYVVRYENLRLYMRPQLKLKKIHRLLEFNWSQWLKLYVEFNTQTKNRSRDHRWEVCKSFVLVNELCCVW